MEKKRTLKLGAIILAVITILALVVSMYNIISFIGTIFSGDSFDLNLDHNESTGEWVILFDASPRNDGILPVSLYLKLTLFDFNDNVIATNSSLVYIGVGSTQSLSFSLVVPSDFVQGDEIQGDEGYVQITMRIRTLGDMVGLTQIMTVGGNGEL